jgi:acetyl-CoA acetyltransferase
MDGLPNERLNGVAAVIGIGHTNWPDDHRTVRAGGKPFDAIGYAAISFVRALADAGIDRSEVDGLIAGPTTGTERMCEVLGIEPKWAAQADAVTAIQSAVLAIHGGLCEVVALVYGNDQRSGATRYGGEGAVATFLAYTYHAPWGLTSQGALYAMLARRFMSETGLTESELGQVAVALRGHASLNPNALMRERITTEDYLNAPHIVEPLRLLDYCLINDGGVALIIASAERAARAAQKPVTIHGIGRHDASLGATALAPRLNDFYRPSQARAAAQCYDMAGLGPRDVSSLQVYDSFSIHVPLALEGYGYCRPGEAGKFLMEDGIGMGGRLPVNTSGGHLSESYMQGWNHQIEAVRQLRGTCGDRQVEDCRFIHYVSNVAGKAMSIIYGRADG